jgi:hypothetical protein
VSKSEAQQALLGNERTSKLFYLFDVYLMALQVEDRKCEMFIL